MKKIYQEIDDLYRKAKAAGGKTLRSEDALDWAERHPGSALHKEITWDDKKAGHLYRVQQMGGIIRTYYIIRDRSEPARRLRYRKYINLPSDRTQTGGYRSVDDVLRSPSRKQEMQMQWLLQIKNSCRGQIAFMEEELKPYFDRIENLVEEIWAELELPVREEESAAV